MTESEHRDLVQKIASAFEVLASELDRAIEAFPRDATGDPEIEALHRARDAAARGAEAARKAIPED